MGEEDERRDALFRAMADTLGREAAETMFALLPQPNEPPASESSVELLATEVSTLAGEFRVFRAQTMERFEHVEHRLDRTDQRFDELDQRFDTLDRRFDALDQRFDGLDQRFDGLDQRFDGLDQRIEGLDQHIGGLDQRIDGLDQHIGGIDQRIDGIDQRFDGIDQRFDGIDQRFDGLADVFATKEDIQILRHELIAEFRGELLRAVSLQQRHLLVAALTAVTALAGLAWTLAQVL